LLQLVEWWKNGRAGKSVVDTALFFSSQSFLEASASRPPIKPRPRRKVPAPALTPDLPLLSSGLGKSTCSR
jgi:hypothetical protein